MRGIPSFVSQLGTGTTSLCRKTVAFVSTPVFQTILKRPFQASPHVAIDHPEFQGTVERVAARWILVSQVIDE